MDRFGILYFSSTGNGLYLAKRIKERTGGDILYIPAYDGDGSEYERLVIVTPIYSFGLPVPVLDLFEKLNTRSEMIAVQSYGGMVGGANRLLYEYALSRSLNIKSVYTIKMPENYTLVMSPPEFYKKRVLKKAEKKIDVIAAKIIDGQYVIPKKRRTHEKTYLKNKSNWRKIAERFSVTDKCVKCGKCIALCPADNIALKDGKIVFSDRCIACLGCFHRCPNKAIVYKNKDNKKRYVNPNIDESDIGKDFKD